MNLNDVVEYQDGVVLAREYYTRATNIDPQAAMTIAEAQQRLALMTTMKTSCGLRPKDQ